MLIVMYHHATDEQMDQVIVAVKEMGLRAEPIPGSLRTAIGVLGNQGYVDDSTIRTLPGVRETIHVSKPYKMASRDFHPKPSVIGTRNLSVERGWENLRSSRVRTPYRQKSATEAGISPS